MTLNSDIRLLGRNGYHDGSRSWTNSKSFLALIVGLIVGFCMAELLVSSSPYQQQWTPYAGHQHGDINDPHHSHDMIDLSGPEGEFGSHIHSNENSTLAIQLYNDVRVLCWIMTNPQNHQKKLDMLNVHGVKDVINYYL